MPKICRTQQKASQSYDEDDEKDENDEQKCK